MHSPSASDFGIRHLAAGFDALYLSGRAGVSIVVADTLEALREAAVANGAAVPVKLAGAQAKVKPYSFGKYRYWISLSEAEVGVTTSTHIPSVRIQPRAEFLHAVGPEAALDFFDRWTCQLLDANVGWSLSRMDLFADVQGWALTGDDRSRFVCRAARRDLHEESDAFTGLEFGRRTTGTLVARIYDKTRQLQRKDLGWWPLVWGDRYDPSLPVLRVEIELGRTGLREYGIHSPADGLAAGSGVWWHALTTWLTYRTPTDDSTRSRWPIAPEWSAVIDAPIQGEQVGVERVRAAGRRARLSKITPALVGYLATAGELCGVDNLDSTLAAVRQLVQRDERSRGVMFPDRIADRQKQDGFQ